MLPIKRVLAVHLRGTRPDALAGRFANDALNATCGGGALGGAGACSCFCDRAWTQWGRYSAFGGYGANTRRRDQVVKAASGAAARQVLGEPNHPLDTVGGFKTPTTSMGAP